MKRSLNLVKKQLVSLNKRILIFQLLFFSFFYFININYTYSFPKEHTNSDSIANVAFFDSKDSNRCKALLNIAWSLKNNNPDSSIELAKMVLVIAKKTNDKRRYAGALGVLGIYYRQIGEYNTALQYLNDALKVNLELSKDDNYYNSNFAKKGVGITYGNMGTLYRILDNYPEALKCYLKALSVAENRKDKEDIATQLNNLGTVYHLQKDNENAINCFTKAIRYFELVNNHYGISTISGNIGIIYKDRAEQYQEYSAKKNFYYTKAIYFSNRAVEICRETNDAMGVSTNLINLGTIYKNKRMFSEAFDSFTEALQISDKLKDYEGKAIGFLNLGSLFLEYDDLNKSEIYLKQSLKLNLELNSLDGKKKCYSNLSKIYQKKGLYKKAFEYYKNFIAARDSIDNESNTKKMVQSLMQFEFDKKEASTKLEQEKKDAIANEEKQKQRVIIYSVSLGLILLLGLAIVIFRSLRQNQKKNKIITAQKAEVEKQKLVAEQQREEADNQRHLVEEKQKEILDSIRYAARIQRSLITNEKYVSKFLNKIRGKNLTIVFLVICYQCCFKNLNAFNTDSLINKFEQATSDSLRIKLACEISESVDYSYFKPWLDKSKIICLKHQAHPTNYYLKYLGMVYNNMGLYYYNIGEVDSAINYYNQCYHTQLDSKELEGRHELLNNIGLIWTQEGRADIAIKYFNASVMFSKISRDQFGVGVSLNNIGLAYQSKGNYVSAIEYFQKALRVFEKIDDLMGIGECVMNIAPLMIKNRDYNKAFYNYNRALEIKVKLNDSLGIATVFNGLGFLFAEAGDWVLKSTEEERQLSGQKIAINYYNDSYDIYKKLGHKHGMGRMLNNIAYQYHMKAIKSQIASERIELFAKAETCYLESIRLRAEIKHRIGVIVGMNNLADLYLKFGEMQKALSLTQKTTKEAFEINSLEEIRNTHNVLSEIYASLNDYKKCFEAYKIYVQYKDSLSNKENTKKITSQLMQYEFDKKEATTKLEQEKKDAIANEEKQKQRAIIYSVSLGLILVLGLAIVIFGSLRQNQKKNKIITAQKAEVERQKLVAEQQREEADNQRHLVEEKQKEILDSIRYAARIQRSLITNEKYIGKNLNKVR